MNVHVALMHIALDLENLFISNLYYHIRIDKNYLIWFKKLNLKIFFMNKISALLIFAILLLSCNEELNDNTDDIICCENNELPNVTLSVDEPIISEGSGVATISVSIDKVPNLGDVNILLEISGTADSSDFILSTDILSFISDTINEITLTAVQDMEVEEDETIVIDIKSVSNGQESGEQQLIITIVDDDEYQMHKDSLP